MRGVAGWLVISTLAASTASNSPERIASCVTVMVDQSQHHVFTLSLTYWSMQHFYQDGIISSTLLLHRLQQTINPTTSHPTASTRQPPWISAS